MRDVLSNERFQEEINYLRLEQSFCLENKNWKEAFSFATPMIEFLDQLLLPWIECKGAIVK